MDVNQAGSGTGFGSTALQAAASTGRQELVDLILESKYGCATSGENFENAVLKAASAGNLTIVQHLIQRFDMDVNLEFSNHLLMEACKFGHDDIAIFSLQFGADPSKPQRYNGWRIPITVAARRGHATVLKVLLQNGAMLRIGGKFDTLSAAARLGGWKQAILVICEFADPADLAQAIKFHEVCVLHGEKSSVPTIDCKLSSPSFVPYQSHVLLSSRNIYDSCLLGLYFAYRSSEVKA